MKKITAFLLSVLLLISFSACGIFPGAETPNVDAQPTPTPDAPEISAPPVTAPPIEPEATPTPTPDITEPEPDITPEPSTVPDPTSELTVYIGGSPVTVPVSPFTGALKDNSIEFTMLYDASAFDIEFSNNAYLLTPLSEDANALDYMEISFISGGKSETILPSFADSYIDFSDIEFASYTPIGEAHTNAESIIAYNSEQYVNAYLVDVSGGIVTVVLSSTSQYSEAFVWLNAFLDTFSLN